MSERLSGCSGGPVTVWAPATSANLGPGFDSLGLCLDLGDLVTGEVVGHGTEVTVVGEGAGVLATDDTNLVVTSLRRAFDLWELPQPGLRLICRNTIPQGRGLGSSAAAIVAGYRLAEALAGRGEEAGPEEALAFATTLEGHADNVAACLLGGLTIAWTDDEVPVAVRLDVDERVSAIVFCAERPMSTTYARGLLPETVTHGQASANVARAALLIVAMTARPELLFSATSDLLHQESRRGGMPDSLALVDSLRSKGIAAVVSGAGPSVLVLATGEPGEMMGRPTPTGWRMLALSVDPTGARVVP